MNVLGHAFVAEQHRPGDALHTLGAVLPDLAAMAGVHLVRPPDRSSPLAAGIHAHHAADAAFHSCPEFVRGTAAMRRELLDAGLRTGPARAVAHVGFELLLDATLADDPVTTSYRRAVDAARSHAAADDVIALPGRARWHALLDRIASTTPPPDFHAPAGIARRLDAILHHRPRLALDADHDLPVVVAVLEGHADVVHRAAPTIVTAVAEQSRPGFTQFGPAEGSEVQESGDGEGTSGRRSR